MADCIIIGNSEKNETEKSFPPLHIDSVIIQSDGWIDFSNYTTNCAIETPAIWKPENKIWEMCFVIQITQTGNNYNTIIGAGQSLAYQTLPCIQWDTTKNKFAIGYPGTASSWKYVLWTQHDYSEFGIYYLKYIWDGEKIELYVSTDGINWVNEISQEETTPCYQPSQVSKFAIGNLGYNGGAVSLYHCGLINVINSYIKIGSEIVWGNN